MAVDGFVAVVVEDAHGEVRIEHRQEEGATAVFIPRHAWEAAFWQHLTQDVAEPDVPRSELASMYREVLATTFRHIREMGFIAPELMWQWQRSVLAEIRVALDYRAPLEEVSLAVAREEVASAALAWANTHFAQREDDPGWERDMYDDMLKEKITLYAVAAGITPVGSAVADSTTDQPGSKESSAADEDTTA